MQDLRGKGSRGQRYGSCLFSEDHCSDMKDRIYTILMNRTVNKIRIESYGNLNGASAGFTMRAMESYLRIRTFGG